MMDGVSTMDTGNNGQLLQMNPEAIAEVKVLTAGYQAEYGRSSGLQITAVTKSGTNRFRGSVYDVMRNSDWNSNSWVNKINGTPKAVDKQSDWGYTLGGPVGKPGGNNKLFFFYAHEYRPRNAANTLRQFRVPTQAERNGDFSASLDNNGAPIPDAAGRGRRRHFAGNRIPAGAAVSDRHEHPEAVSAAEHHAGAGHVLQPRVPLADVQDAEPAAGLPRRLPVVVGAAVHGEIHRSARVPAAPRPGTIPGLQRHLQRLPVGPRLCDDGELHDEPDDVPRRHLRLLEPPARRHREQRRHEPVQQRAGRAAASCSRTRTSFRTARTTCA